MDISKYSEIIIWGAAFPPTGDECEGNSTSHGHSMEKLSSLLRANNAWDKVLAIVDSNGHIYGKNRLGIPVKNPEFILEHPDALVVINSISIQSIKDALDELKARNDCAVIPYYFYHGTLAHPYNNDAAKKDIKQHGDAIKRLYDPDDKQTKRYLDIILDMRSLGKDDLYDLGYYEGTGKNLAYFCDPELAPHEKYVTYIDVGAFDGDSLEPVETFYGERLKRYIGFEPNKKCLAKLKNYIIEHNMTDKATLFSYALGSINKKIRFSAAGSTSHESKSGNIILEQKTFDSLTNLEIIGDTMVKMDIEGSELDALYGMQNLIKTRSPYLAICLYHKETDLFLIADYIKKLNPAYHLYIRGGWHLECWAVPPKHFN